MRILTLNPSHPAVCGLECLRSAALTATALAAFAANSILCRLALADGAIDPAGFTAVRLAAGAGALTLITGASRSPHPQRQAGSWASAALLGLYALAFSFAYLSLSAGTGALILFGAVQVTMLSAALASGERPGWVAWGGLLAAVGGLVYLARPGVETPSLTGAALMGAAGWAWGVYSLRGRRLENPLAVTGDNFRRSLPMAALALLAALPHLHLTPRGVTLAAVSGAVTSGLGYVAWYAALPRLTATQAAAAQLLVPVIAAAGGVAFLSEVLSRRLVVAAVLILGGVAAALAARNPSRAAGRRDAPKGRRNGTEPRLCAGAGIDAACRQEDEP